MQSKRIVLRGRVVCRRAAVGCELLERRTLLSALMVNDTPGTDTITLGVTPAGGIKTVVNGQETDYAPGAWDAAIVQSTAGGDTINVEATVVPTTVHYLDSVTINVGDSAGVQDINATLNMNGAAPGPVMEGGAAINIDDSGDSAGRRAVLATEGEQEQITGLAPAEIDVGVVVPPASAGVAGADSLSLTTGSGNDAVTIGGLQASLPASIFNAGGHDTVDIGAGSLAQVRSNIFAGPTYVVASGTQTDLTVDDSRDTSAAQFTISALFPPGPGAYGSIAVQGTNVPQATFTFRVAGVTSATIDGGSGGNTFDVQATPPGPGSNLETVTLNTGAGNDTVTADSTNTQSVLNVNGQAGDDSLGTGPIGPFMGILGPVNFDGGAGTNALTVQGPVANPTGIAQTPVLVTAGRVSHQGINITYSNVSTLRLENGRFNVNNDLGPVGLTVSSQSSGLSFESPTNVTINSGQNLGALDLVSGPVTLASGGNKVLNVQSLDISGGSLDLTDNALQVHYGAADPFSQVRSSIIAHTLFTSSADSHHALGYADSADGIVTGLAGDTVLVKYALDGDSNLDGRVNFADLLFLGQNFGKTGANWDQGDFNDDGKVGFDDLLLLAQNYGTGDAARARLKVAH